MSKFEKSMQEIFDIEPKSVTSIPESVPVSSKNEVSIPIVTEPTPLTTDADLQDAYRQSRDNLQDIIDQGKDAMEDILHVARESELPRAFEVFAKMMDSVVNANKELLDIQKKMRDMTGQKTTQSTGTNIENAVFVGSTAELSKLIKEKRNNGV